MAQHRIAKSAQEREVLAAMTALAAAYSGPITHCPPGVARAHEAKVTYEPLRRPAGVEPDRQMTSDGRRVSR